MSRRSSAGARTQAGTPSPPPSAASRAPRRIALSRWCGFPHRKTPVTHLPRRSAARQPPFVSTNWRNPMTPKTLMHARALRARLEGDLVLPGDENWDEARQAWNLAVDQRPAAVALPETADDVVAIVDFAREHGYRVAPQGTGHNAGPLEWLDETILLKTERMRRV